tara:strand:- start:14772 stop:15116 length:345 start_codon:yes stop_codon:yes gene_type:complete
MSEIEKSVANKILERAKVGFEKYGITMADENLSRREWHIHAQNEALDLSVYLEKLIQMDADEDTEISKLREEIEATLNEQKEHLEYYSQKPNHRNDNLIGWVEALEYVLKKIDG